MRRWKAYRYSKGEVYEKTLRYKNPEEGISHNLKITIETEDEDDDFFVRSFKMENNFLDYVKIPGGSYSSHITENLGRVSRPMKKREIKAFFRIIYRELADFRKAYAKNLQTKRTERSVHLADALDKITDYMELYDNFALKRIGPDWRKYHFMMKSNKFDETEKEKQWFDSLIKAKAPRYLN